MNSQALVQVALYLVLLTALAVPLGAFMADVLEGRRTFLTPVLGGLERLCYRAAGVDAAEEMSWKRYALAMLAFNLVGVLAVYVLQRLPHLLPLNPDHLPPVAAHSAVNTAVSFATNTNWQGYGGESTMSMLTQMLGLAVQNFVSAASGIAVMAAFVRGLSRHASGTVGNFWADLVRGTLYILLPLAFVLALLLVWQGVPQTFAPAVNASRVESVQGADGKPVTEQRIVLGPVASQVAIKQLGTNGGGYYNANSAHPYENPTPLTNLLESLAILAIAAGLCFTFGRMVGDPRQGWAIFAAMTALFAAFLAAGLWAETRPDPRLAALGVATAGTPTHEAGAMEGKEVRFGVASSVLWATATTSASNGSVNAMHDSFSPLGGMVPMALMQLGEVVYGGVGSGLYGMLVFALLAVFMAGLMVGRTPEYLGKKIEAFEMKMAMLVVLVPPALVLLGTALAVSARSGIATLGNPGTHGFSEILYALSSASNNNGSAFAGLGAMTPFYDGVLAVAMFFGRYALAVPVLAMAGSLARKKRLEAGPGTLSTHGPLFVAMLVGVVVIVGALTFFPALALGPIAEHLSLRGLPPLAR
jgi:potassium-transporting ATPase potassium-binding subunit